MPTGSTDNTGPTHASPGGNGGLGLRRGWLTAGLIVAFFAVGALLYSLASGHQGGEITVSGQYVREPASPDVAAAYFTITNHNSHAVTLTSVRTPAAGSAQVMTDEGGAMTDTALTVPAHGSRTLRPDGAHLMLERPKGVTKGATIRLALSFDDGTRVPVDVKVIGVLDPVP